MTDIEIVYNCVFYKTYQNKVEFLIEIEKIADRKLLAGLLMDLSIKSERYECEKNEILQICSEVLSPEELKTDYLIDSNIYYQNSLGDINKGKMSEAKFLLDFYTYLLSDDKVNDDIKDIIKEKIGDTKQIDINKLLKENKEHLPSLKQKMIDSELYEVISLIDKYL